MHNFQKDLELGEKVQRRILKILKPQYPTIKNCVGKVDGYDLYDDFGYTAEVKFDELSKSTGNVGIEYECFGKPSGIKRTTAYEWFHVFYYNGKWGYSQIRTADLKSFLRNNIKCFTKASGGDKDSSKMILINVYDFVDAFSFVKFT